MGAFVAFLAVALARNVLGKLYVAPQSLPRSQYDFIVVGAGTAGNVIAARLSENPEFTVCVIEAGGNDVGIAGLEIPLIAPADLSNTSVFWDYSTVPQQSLDGRNIPIQRGKLLGGSSSVNFLFWTRGSRDDFDRMAHVTDDSGWSWNSILPYFIKAETFTAPVDHHNTSGEFNPSVHGFNGPLLTTLAGFPLDVDPRIMAATESNPKQFPFNLDMNGGNTIGIGWTQSSTGGGQRSSSATAYLHPIINRPNLDVLIGAQVTRLISRTIHPDLRTVEFAQNATSPRLTIHASKEVILSAGAINTPQILLLSGVGDSQELSALGIKTVVNLPGVGQALQDHPLIEMQWSSTDNETVDDITRNATLLDDLITQWATTRTGVLTDAPSNLVGWMRLPDNSTVLQNFPDPTAGPTSAHAELIPANAFSPFRSPPPAEGSFFSVITSVASPLSRGTVKLNSNNPFDFPLIDPAYLTSEVDLEIAVASIGIVQEFVSSPSFDGFILEPFVTLANAIAQDDLAAYVRNQTVSFWHPCCSAKMGDFNDKSAVVDSKLRLKGAKGVRIVDASIFPYIPAAHTQAPVYAIAERAADIIKQTYY